MKLLALTAAAALSLASFAAGAAPITTLDTVQVRPSAEQLAERAAPRVVTLAPVQVRPSAGQRAEGAARPVVTLATVQVRPSAAQVAARATGDDRVTTLATVNVRPSAEQVAALELAGAVRQARAEEAAGLVRRMVEATLLKLPAADLSLAAGSLQQLAESLAQAGLGH